MDEQSMVFVSGVLTREQVLEVFDRAEGMLELDRETGEFPPDGGAEAPVTVYLDWANEEVLANAAY